mmetsp:Transcript_45704/g.99496  ORF Transcript_45704/g.99496 Transcript_45704/m.99496 type:complete len:212 (+) Transcript_45704:697-1332(+)
MKPFTTHSGESIQLGCAFMHHSWAASRGQLACRLEHDSEAVNQIKSKRTLIPRRSVVECCRQGAEGSADARGKGVEPCGISTGPCMASLYTLQHEGVYLSTTFCSHFISGSEHAVFHNAYALASHPSIRNYYSGAAHQAQAYDGWRYLPYNRSTSSCSRAGSTTAAHGISALPVAVLKPFFHIAFDDWRHLALVARVVLKRLLTPFFVPAF